MTTRTTSPTSLRWAAVSVGLLLAVASVAPVLAQRGARPAPVSPADNATCLICHGDPTATSGSGRTIGLDPARFDTSVHGTLGMTCVTCHTDIEKTQTFPHAAKLAPVQCATCHGDAVTAYDRGIHAAARRTNGRSVAATCVDCHSSHDIRPAKDPESRTHPLNLSATCARCHGDPTIIAAGHIRIGNAAALYHDSIHGRAITRSGLIVSATCSSCHGSHDIRQKTDPESRVHRANLPGVCGTCHEGIRTQFASGVHGSALAAGNPRAPVCQDCHTAHEIRRADVTSWQLDVIRECGTCHADKIKTYRDTFHGQVTSLGFVRVATCASCHGAHGIHGKADPRSMVSPERLMSTCQTCHPGATASFAQYDPHADKHDRERNPTLYYASSFMTWLLVGVFGFFGLHAVLWLPRGIAARRRFRRALGGEAASPGAADDGPPDAWQDGA